MSQAVHLRKYGVEATIDFELYEIDGVDLKTDATLVAADCEVQKDGGNFVQCTNTGASEDGTYSITFTTTEMEAARIMLKVVDAATKVFLDKVIVVETYGNASAQHAFDFDKANQDVTVTAIGANVITAASTHADYVTEIVAACASALDTYSGPTKAEMDTAHALLATIAKQDVIDGIVDDILVDTNAIEILTKVSGDGDLVAVKTKTDTIPTNPAATGADGDTLETLSDQLDNIAELGDGSVSVNHNYGGADNMTVKDGNGVAIDNVQIRAYLQSDYNAGNRAQAYLKGRTQTDVNGQWEQVIRLDPADYTVEFSKQGDYETNTKEVTVS